ncbi:MAG: hypothetical protein JJU36_17375 [Phycisphaeraceae bacterium]|nr:hypothetical protein [Phycisphaeraceae bacterium]
MQLPGPFRVVALAALLLSSRIAVAEFEFDHYMDVPLVVAQDPSLFQGIWAEGHERTVRVALFGDSQETNPGGQGGIFVPRLNFEFARHYGNAPASQFIAASQHNNHWLGASAFASRHPSSIPVTKLLPGMVANYWTNSPASHGHLARLETTASGVPSVPDQTYFIGNQAVVEVLLATMPGSGDLAYRAVATNAAKGYHNGTDVAGVVHVDLDSDELAFHKITLGPFNINGFNNIEVVMRGTNETGVTILGSQFINVDNPHGVVIDPISAGGWRASSLTSFRPDAGMALRARGPYDVAILHYGANDGAYVNPDQYMLNVMQLISDLRSDDWSGDPDLPIIIITDPERTFPPPHGSVAIDRYSQYAAVGAAIAEADPRVMAINSRRAAVEWGWHPDSPYISDYLSDDVHYSVTGGKLLAAIEASLMLGLPGPRWGDLNLDGYVDDVDLAVLQANLGLSGMTYDQGDLTGSRTVGLRDAFVLLEAYGHGTPHTTIVPEPATLALIMPAALLIATRRRTRTPRATG